MSGSLGKSESNNQNQANFGQDVWGPQGDALQNLYGQMGNLFNQTMTGAGGSKGGADGGSKGAGGPGGAGGMMYAGGQPGTPGTGSYGGVLGQIPGAVEQQQGVFDSANPAWQQQLGGGAYQGMDLQGMYNQALQGGGNEQFINQSIMGGAGNNYVDAMKKQLQGDSEQRLGRSLAMNDARAAGAGMSGSSRQGLTESRLYEDANRNLARQQTGIGFGAFDKDLDRKLGIAQRADQFDMGRLNNVSGMLGNQNAAMQGGLNFGQGMQNLGMGQFAPSMAPWGAAGEYANAIGRPTVLGQGGASGSGASKGKGASGGGK